LNSTKRGRAIRLALAASGALGVLAIFVGVAGAAGNSTATLAAGTLAIANPTGITFSGTLNGATQYWSDTTDTLQVVNPGRNGGWNVTAVFDDFSCSTAATCDSTTLTDLSVNGDTGSSTASTAPTPTCTASSVCILPTLSSLTFPQPISDNATPTKIFNADTDTGVGKVTAPIVWWLTTPADTLAGTYTSTLTLGINSGP
jgi:hypothetical protein